jgi:hypothetical protein
MSVLCQPLYGFDASSIIESLRSTIREYPLTAVAITGIAVATPCFSYWVKNRFKSPLKSSRKLVGLTPTQHRAPINSRYSISEERRNEKQMIYTLISYVNGLQQSMPERVFLKAFHAAIPYIRQQQRALFFTKMMATATPTPPLTGETIPPAIINAQVEACFARSRTLLKAQGIDLPPTSKIPVILISPSNGEAFIPN